MKEEIRSLLDSYGTWLRDKTTLRQLKDWVEVTTPYLDRHNDYLQIYVGRENGGYILTDDSYILGDLERSGCKLDSPKRQSLLKMTLNGFGVQLNDSALEARASRDNFALRKHNLIQAMLAVNDLFYLAEPTVKSLFYEDVEAWLELHQVRFTPRVKFSGKSGYDHLFDFVIPKSSQEPERIVRAISHPSRDSAQALAFAWVDTKEVRPPDSRAYAILNDSAYPVSSSITEAMKSYDVYPVLWSHREEVQREFAL